MNLLNKMVTALRGGINDAGESIIDAQALRIIDQEVRDAEDELKVSKQHLAEIIAKQKVAEEKKVALEQEVSEYEGYALKALEQDDESLALEVSEKIVILQARCQTVAQEAAGFAVNAEKLRTAVNRSEKNILQVKQQVDTVRATASVQKAQTAVAERYAGTDSKVRTAMDSLERIKEQQTEKAARLSASEELVAVDNDETLQDKLQAAGIIPGNDNAQAVLARLKEQANKS